MRKLFCIIIAAAVLFLASCGGESKKGPLAAAILGEDSVIKDMGISVWEDEFCSPYQDESADEMFEFDFSGEHFGGTYAYSMTILPAQHVSHFYNGVGYIFSISAEDKSLDSFYIEYPETQGTLSPDDCRKRADKVASQYIKVSDYETELSGDDDTYFVTYFKSVEGIRTSDVLAVGISSASGGIESFGGSLYTSFGNVDSGAKAMAKRFASEDVSAVIRARLDTYYDDEYEFSLLDETLVRLPDGSVALFAEVSTTRQITPEGGGYTYPSVARFEVLVYAQD